MSGPPPPVVPRKPSMLRVMIPPGEQPPPSAVPIYSVSIKGMNIKPTCLCIYREYLFILCSIYMFELALMAFSPSTAQRIELKETQIMYLHWMQSEKWYVFACYTFDVPL